VFTYEKNFLVAIQGLCSHADAVRNQTLPIAK
jgi:hypothetical protein